MTQKTVAIIGMGFVGANLARWFEEQKQTVLAWDIDPAKANSDLDAISRADMVFLCVPTPYRSGQKGYDLTAIRSNLQELAARKSQAVIIIKSTVLPGTTQQLQDEFPTLTIGFVPEFLTEKYAWEDTLHPETSIFGYTAKSYHVANDVLSVLPEATFERIMPAAEAEMVKIARNNYFVNKIVFMNMLYDTCQANGVEYETVRDALASDRRIRRSHTEIFHQGGRGGAGTCFTKDTPAFRDFIQETTGGAAAEFIEKYTEINEQLIKESGKDTGRQYE